MISNFSAYDFLTNFVPGVVFVALCSDLSSVELTDGDILKDAALYFFVGVVISRIGSLVVEPTLRKLSILEEQHYFSFLKAEKSDEKIHVILEVRNFYRSLFTALVCYFGAVFYFWVAHSENALTSWNILLVAVSVILLFSFLKQSKYLNSRVSYFVKDN